MINRLLGATLLSRKCGMRRNILYMTILSLRADDGFADPACHFSKHLYYNYKS